MATQGERRALMFLAAVAILGAGSRACRARRPSIDTTGLASQLAAVESVQETPRGARRRIAPVARGRQPAFPVDLDIATAEEIEALPGIGPSLAGRIVKDREAHGSFGCLDGLDRVKGVGPALLARLDSLVTFSGGAVQCASSTRPPGGSPRR